MNNSAKWFAVGPLHILALVLVLVVACGGGGKPEANPQGIGYTGGSSVCSEFRSVVLDAGKGRLTDSEVIELLKIVASKGSTTEPDIRTASKSMLDTATQGDARALAEATEEMVDACTEHGYWEQS